MRSWKSSTPASGLKDDTTYIHCCTLNDTEWKLIKDTGGTISIAGYVETLMGHGNPPTQKAIDLGIRPSLSVDVETSVPNDFFTQMRTVFSLQKNEVWARRLAGDKNPPKFLTVREVLEFATIEGARANGLDKKIGTLTPGKEADIILLRTDRLNVMPMNNAVGAVVTSMTAAERRHRADRRQGDEAQRQAGRRRHEQGRPARRGRHRPATTRPRECPDKRI